MIQCDDKTVRVPSDKLDSFLQGRTISKIDNSSCNILGIEFLDGTSVQVVIDYSGIAGLYELSVEELA